MNDYTFGRLSHTPRIVKAFTHALGHLERTYDTRTAEVVCYATTRADIT